MCQNAMHVFIWPHRRFTLNRVVSKFHREYKAEACVKVIYKTCLYTKSAPWGPLSFGVSLVAVITLLTTLCSKPDLARLFRFLFSS